MKRILCLIENLGSGGAERQLTGLAVMLKQQGYEVEVWYYVKKEFYLSYLQENGVVGRCQPDAASKKKRFFALRKHIKAYGPDTIISYSVSPSMIACLLKLFGARFNLIVSERSTTQHLDRREKVKFFLYRFSDTVVPNSQSQGDFIQKKFCHLKNKVKVISNLIDTNRFFPANNKKESNGSFKIICVGRLVPPKNIPNFIESVSLIVKKGYKVFVNWYGSDSVNKEYAKLCYDAIQIHGLQDFFVFNEPKINIEEFYQQSDFFCLPSLYEGFPNVLCEAMCCGLPVVCSRVSDVPQIMEEGVNGFIFDPLDVDDMAEKLEKIITLSEEERRKMAIRSREIAVGKFSSNVFVSKYLELI